MKFEPFAEIAGSGILTLPKSADKLGFCVSLYERQTMAADTTIPFPFSFVEDQIVYSMTGVQRGFSVQGQLITALLGRIVVVCVDVRKNSPTFMKMTRVVLDENTPKSFYAPPGTAVAFLSVTDSMAHSRFTPDTASGNFNSSSPEVAYVWPPGEWVRSDADRALPTLMDYLNAIE